MSNNIDPAVRNSFILSQVRASLRRYAFLFTALGAIFTGINAFHQVYLRSVDRATMLSTNEGLMQRQLILRKASAGGRAYRMEMKKDEEFALSLIALLNFYEQTGELINSWALLGPVVRRSIKCPLVKHTQIFLLGRSHPKGHWTTDGAFFEERQFPEMMQMYKDVAGNTTECEESWK